MDEREEVVGADKERRRKSRARIIEALANARDESMKGVLLLLLHVVEEIGDKIDSVLADEASLRAAVLNGHEPVHHKHHEWVAKKIAAEEEAAKDERASRRKIRDGLIEKLLWAALVLLAGAGWWPK